MKGGKREAGKRKSSSRKSRLALSPLVFAQTRLKCANIAAVTAWCIWNFRVIERPAFSALIIANLETIALIDRRAASQQCVRWCRAAVHLKRAEERVNG